MDPPFKTSAFVPYKLKYSMDILRQDFPNETLEQRYGKVSYKMGADDWTWIRILRMKSQVIHKYD